MSLPASVTELAPYSMNSEAVVLELFRRYLPDLHFTALIEQEMAPPYVLLRKITYTSTWKVDDRFLDEFYFSADVFNAGREADIDGPHIIAAMWNALQISTLRHDDVLDGLGWVASSRLVEPARRRADFANSEGPVQYADLPQDWTRYTATFYIQIKRAHIGPNVFNI